MQLGRLFELMAVVLLLNVGVGMPVAAHAAVSGGRTRSVAPAIR